MRASAQGGRQRCCTRSVALLSGTLGRGPVGSYQLQAAIAAVHDEAASSQDTDWTQILTLYGVLQGLSDNPMVALNHAIAFAMVHGPTDGLARLDELGREPRLGGHYRLEAVRAHLLEMSGDLARAVEHYRSAAERTASTPERNYLRKKAASAAERSTDPA